MTHWWFLATICFACFMVGGFIGVAVMALCAIAKEPDESSLNSISIRLDHIFYLLREINRKEVIQMADLTILREKVTKIETVGDSMKETMFGIAAALEAAKTDPVAIQAIADELSLKADEWAAAVVASTPAAPTP